MKSLFASALLLSLFLSACSGADVFEEDSMGPEPTVDTSSLITPPIEP